MGVRRKIGNADYEKGYRVGYIAGFETGRKNRKHRGLTDLSKVVLLKTCNNIGEDYAEVDQFICSECGLHLQDWVRIDEEDFEDGIVHEYIFRYCPNCGAKIEEK